MKQGTATAEFACKALENLHGSTLRGLLQHRPAKFMGYMAQVWKIDVFATRINEFDRPPDSCPSEFRYETTAEFVFDDPGIADAAFPFLSSKAEKFPLEVGGMRYKILGFVTSISGIGTDGVTVGMKVENVAAIDGKGDLVPLPLEGIARTWVYA